MGLFRSNRSIHKLIHERLAMEWRLLGNVYRNHLQVISGETKDTKNLELISSKCVSINSIVQQGSAGFGKVVLNKDLINGLMIEILDLDSKLEDKPPLSVRTLRLVGITTSIMVGNYDGIFEDANGNHADWYRGL